MSFYGQKDWRIQVAKGEIPDHSSTVFSALTRGVGTNGVEKTVRNLPEVITYFTLATQLYASSTDAGDTTATVAVVGLDSNFDEVTRTVTLNGQNQVALSGTMLRVFSAVVTGSTQVNGDVYIAETDTLTAGVPDTDSKKQVKINQGDNVGLTGTITVPNGFKFIAVAFSVRMGKQQDARVKFFSRLEGGLFSNIFDFEIFEQHSELSGLLIPLVGKTDFEARLIPGIDNVSCFVGYTFIKYKI